MNLAAYTKFIVAIVGAGVTSALTLVVKDSPEFFWLTIVSAIVTAAGVYVFPNADGKHEA